MLFSCSYSDENFTFISDYKTQGYKTFLCSTQLSTKFFLLINVKMPTIVGIFTFMSRKNSNLGLSKPKKAKFLDIGIVMSI